MAKTLFIHIFVSCLITFSTVALGSPAPMTSSNRAITLIGKRLTTQEGLQLTYTQTPWTPITTITKQDLSQVKFSSSELSGTLEFQLNKRKENTSFEKDVKDWIKDYPFYGFKILATKTIKQEDQKGIVIDLVHYKKQKQVRQIILEGPDQTSLVFTCQDDIPTFNETLNQCNQIIKSANWISSTEKKSINN